ncbi:MAG TPA: DUF5995 family protein [Chitinophagaceae bacterium]|nr:DUF5995 family protein [Chitinophagaceae bacterium]
MKESLRKTILLTACMLMIIIKGFSQRQVYPFVELFQLDSLSRTAGIAKHFGMLYYEFLLLVEEKLVDADSSTQRFIRNFERVFARFYIEACQAAVAGKEIPLPAWRAYFKDSSLLPVQYYLLGANAHLNGGLAEAIAHSYGAEEWPVIKKKYYLFNSCLNETYRFVHAEAVRTSSRAKLLHLLTLSLDRLAGNFYLYKWRKRQMRLTEYYYTDQVKYRRLLEKVNRKKEKIDRLVMTQF